MFGFIKLIFSGLLSFSRSLATESLLLNNNSCMLRSVLLI